MNTAAQSEFEMLAASHRDAVYRQMVRLCGNREDAEDVLMDALLAAYRGMETLREREAFGAWLAMIARRLCFHLRSREKVVQMVPMEEHASEQLLSAEPAPEETLLAKEMRLQVRRAIDTLPSALRTVYVLRDVDEMPGEEVAKQLKISMAAMKSRLHRARKQMREYLDAVLSDAKRGKGQER